MPQLFLVGEGRTELVFANTILKPHLLGRGVNLIKSVSLQGGLNYDKLRGMVRKLLAEMPSHIPSHLTTMVDLYKLPNAFPGFTESRTRLPLDRVRFLEQCWKDDVADARFVPYIQLHEFEALLFVDLSKWNVLGLPREAMVIRELEREKRTTLRNATNPELIDDGEATAPSKRIRRHVPDYEKVTAAMRVLEAVGLEEMRKVCDHFHDWLTTLENLPSTGATPAP